MRKAQYQYEVDGRFLLFGYYKHICLVVKKIFITIDDS